MTKPKAKKPAAEKAGKTPVPRQACAGFGSKAGRDAQGTGGETRRHEGQEPPAKAAAAKPSPAKTAPARKPAPAAAKPAVAAAPAKPVVASAPKAAPAAVAKPAAVTAKPVAPVVAAKPAEAAVPVKKPAVKPDFKAGEFIVYPAHGVGRIVGIEQEVAGMKLELFVINFDKDKMTLRVPVAKASCVGMRRLAAPDVVATALQTLRAARASSARCGAAGPRNTRPRSTRAT